jgi:hypothetical protein
MLRRRACEHLGMTAHVASLRVYEPLAAFSGPARARWEAYAARGDAPSPAEAAVTEREAAVRACAGASAGVLPELDERAFVTERDGVRLVCPWSTRLRSVEALEEFLSDVPVPLVEAYLPRAPEGDLDELLDAERLAGADESGSEHRHVLTSTWHVPLRWFVLVDAAEREVHLGTPAGSAGTSTGGPAGAPAGAPAGEGAVDGPAAAGTRRRTGRSLVYRTPMSRARRRVARGLEVLRRTVEDGVVTAGVEDLGRWLEEFHPRSLVELDYGGLVHLMDDEQLEQDESARDVTLALAALGEGDAERAAAAYARVTTRMKVLQAVESAN